MLRTELEQFLAETFQYHNFDDFCKNGLQVEGKEEIRKIAFGVSFNVPFLEQAIARQIDAIVVHHGFFGKDFFSVIGPKKQRLRGLFEHEISLFGIHLPLDTHPEYGNNVQLFAYLDADIIEPYAVGFIGKNSQQYTVSQMLDIFHQKLHPPSFISPSEGKNSSLSVLMPTQQHGFLAYENGPEIPETIAIISGGSEWRYRKGEVMDKGIDTFICGSVSEAVPAISYETQTNFINIGHYWSEKAGPLALQAAIDREFDVETVFLEVENIV